MTAVLEILSAGPSLTVQDLGRSGFLAQGLTRGGAADRLALFEGAALLDQDPELAAIEMVGMGGTFRASIDVVIALTGAPMTATIDGAAAVWNASHLLPAGATLKIGSTRTGGYGYLQVAGGIDTAIVMGARSAHLKSGVGGMLMEGDRLPLVAGAIARPGQTLQPSDRMSGGAIRVMESLQTSLFSDATRARFSATTFRRDPRGNRQGVRMDSEDTGFFVDGGLSIVSEVILTGDIQITGDGAPYVLMCECQTTGGYPRIATVLPADLPRVAQAPIGAALTFEFVNREAAVAIEARARAERLALPGQVEPLLRDPADMADLLGYQLVGGAVSALADPFDR
ncbi:MAG: biotin-dependent carboxyltransferase family protein [Pseudomonadota bacterium]